MDYTVGIDLGTSNSCVAIYKDKQLEIIEDEHGNRVMPSWVAFTPDFVLTGHEALEQYPRYMKTTVFEVKRLIGQKFDDPKVKQDISALPYKIVNEHDALKIQIEHKEQNPLKYTPQEISAYILNKLKQIAEARLNSAVNRVVVTVPAYFNDAQRQATKDAAQIAGFKSINVINEPTAAALAFDYKHKKDYKRNVAVYDFGGGTFDVSIVSIGRGKCEVKATEGDSHLGGTDIDLNLVKYITEEFKRMYGKEVDNDRTVQRRLKNKCEKAKKQLSGLTTETIIDLDSFCGEDFCVTLTRAELEQLNQKLFDRTLEILDRCLKTSGFTKEDIDEVVLVGGSARIPKIQQMLKDYFGEEKINKGVNPDEAVACGAAIYASTLGGDKNEFSIIRDITSLSLGTNVIGDKMNFIIPRNTPLPAKAIKRYETVTDGQETMEFPIYQGESSVASENFELGNFTMTGLTPASAGKVIVEVLFQIDNEGLLKVTAKEINAGSNIKDIVIDVKKNGLNEEQILQRIIELEANKENELMNRKFSDHKYKLQDMLNKVKVHAEKFEEEERDTILDYHDEISKWLAKSKIEYLSEFPEKEKQLEQMLKVTP